MTIQQTSLEAYQSIIDELGDRQSEVYCALKTLKEANNLMLSQYLKLPINSITPRVLELRELKLVGVSKEAPCPITKRKSIWWKCIK